MSTDGPEGILVLPWLPLERPAEVGDITFLPVDINSPPQLENGTLADLSRLSIFREIERERDGEQPAPIRKCALIVMRRQNVVRVLTNEESVDVPDAVQALCFACLAENEFFTFPTSGHYVNSSCFQLYFLGDDILVFYHWKKGTGEMRTWGYEDVVLTRPLECALARDVKWDDDFLAALWSGALPQGESAPLSGLRQAIWLFNRASADEHHWQQFLIQQLPQEVVMMVQAMEHLLHAKGDGPLTRNAVDTISGNWAQIQGLPPRAEGCWVATLGMPDDYRAVHYWLREFIQVRHDTTHAVPLAEKKWAWDVGEHVIMAAFVFPLIVKCFLASQDLYELTDADRDRLGVVDRLLCLDDWGREKISAESNWSKEFREAKWEKRKPQAVELLRKLYDEGTPIIPDGEPT